MTVLPTQCNVNAGIGKCTMLKDTTVLLAPNLYKAFDTVTHTTDIEVIINTSHQRHGLSFWIVKESYAKFRNKKFKTCTV